jgi:hypothetical protein
MARPRFEVFITGEGLDRALDALNGAGIPTMGPTFTWREGQSAPPTVGHLMIAVLQANSASEAEGRVSDVLRTAGDYTIEGVAELNLPATD